jgi:hypothetical protein
MVVSALGKSPSGFAVDLFASHGLCLFDSVCKRRAATEDGDGSRREHAEPD